MGMFDYIRFEGAEYQTKDTPAQALDQYEIREDGTLWYQNYDCELVDDPDHFLGGYLKQFNHRWEFVSKFDGVIRFYREDKENGGYNADKWIEYKALFMDGKIIKIQRQEQ